MPVVISHHGLLSVEQQRNAATALCDQFACDIAILAVFRCAAIFFELQQIDDVDLVIVRLDDWIIFLRHGAFLEGEQEASGQARGAIGDGGLIGGALLQVQEGAS